MYQITIGKVSLPPSPWFYQNEGEAESIVSVYIYMCLLGYPANKTTILTAYNNHKHSIRDVKKHRCAPYDFKDPPGQLQLWINTKGSKIIMCCSLRLPS
ncbi:hypothetical protein M0R45_020132 [Rubus argutus]|uniref:Uncharacterized protein n=1 Tax=Rubus argutus TaxID=59490 RepID=A0AAW1XAT9_RUBAR